MTNKYSVTFYGTFAVRDPEGSDVTPKGSKAKGALAMICATTEMRRGRRWLEAKLWSNRSAGQASGSMRQTLSEIRSAFSSDEGVFEANRLDVWINLERIETDLDATTQDIRNDRELLEGLDIRDPAFKKWLSAFRARHHGVNPAPSDELEAPSLGATGRIRINAIVTEQESAIERITGNIIADQVAKSLEERLSTDRFALSNSSARSLAPADLEIRCNVAKDDGQGIVFLQVHHGLDGRILFSGHRSLSDGISSAFSENVVQGLIHSAVSKLNHRLPFIFDLKRPEIAAAGFNSLGLKKLARFDTEVLADAKSYFEQAHNADSNGIYLAWRAFALMAELIEGADSDREAQLEEVQQLTANTLQTSGDNAFALALVSLTRIMLDDDLSAPAELAERAIKSNEDNIFARQTLAVAHSAVGDTEKAYLLSKACQQSNIQNDFSHLWDLYHALVCISSGRFEEARIAATRATNTAPNFIAPRRQLIALCANAGDLEGARTHLNVMRSLEHDFSLDRYLNDFDYPVLTLRNAGLITPLKRDDFGE